MAAELANTSLSSRLLSSNSPGRPELSLTETKRNQVHISSATAKQLGLESAPISFAPKSGEVCVAAHAYDAVSGDELSVRLGDQVTILEKSVDPGW